MSKDDKIKALRRELRGWRKASEKDRDENSLLRRFVGKHHVIPTDESVPLSLRVAAQAQYDGLMQLAMEQYDGDRDAAERNFGDFLLGFVDAALHDTVIDAELLRGMLAIDNARLQRPASRRKKPKLRVIGTGSATP